MKRPASKSVPTVLALALCAGSLAGQAQSLVPSGTNPTNTSGSNRTALQALPTSASLGRVDQTPNPLRVALHRWYGATDVGVEIPVGTFPGSATFDGDHMWVSMNTGELMKVRASDGAVLGTYPCGASPVASCFDGAHIWVTNSGFADTVTNSIPWVTTWMPAGTASPT